MSKSGSFAKAGLWLGPIALVAVLLLAMVASGHLRIELHPDKPDGPGGWPRSFAEKSYYDTLANIITWDDFCGTAMIDDLASLAGDDLSRETERTDTVPDRTLLEENSTDFSRSCTVLVESRDCGGMQGQQLTRFDQFQVDLAPYLSEEDAVAAYGTGSAAIADLAAADASEATVGSPWRDGIATHYTSYNRFHGIAMALGDFYTVMVSVNRADEHCEPGADELVHMIAEDFMPALHASIEECIAAGG